MPGNIEGVVAIPDERDGPTDLTGNVAAAGALLNPVRHCAALHLGRPEIQI